MKRTKADLEQYLAAAERKVLALQGELEQSRSVHRILQKELAKKEAMRGALESLLIKERAERADVLEHSRTLETLRAIRVWLRGVKGC